jgi:hypothetical protein
MFPAEPASASAPQGLRSNPSLRLPCQLPTLHPIAAMLRSTAHSSSADRTPLWFCPKCGGPMKVLERTYRCPNPTPFSTTVGHYRSMKQLAHNSKIPHGSPPSAPVRPTPDPIPTARHPDQFRVAGQPGIIWLRRNLEKRQSVAQEATSTEGREPAQFRFSAI